MTSTYIGEGNVQDNPLVGKTLTGIMIAEDRQAMLFKTAEGEIIAKVYADCCSYTWIEGVELPALGFPAIVTSVQDLDMPDSTKYSAFHADYEYLQFYGCKICTDRGDMVIDYRNSSNGYYGGSLSWPGDYFYGGVDGQNISKQKWEQLA